MNSIHISTARHMLASPEPVDITVLDAKGNVNLFRNVVGLKHNHYGGVRNIKFLDSGEIRKIRDCLIIAVNGMEVFL